MCSALLQDSKLPGTIEASCVQEKSVASSLALVTPLYTSIKLFNSTGSARDL